MFRREVHLEKPSIVGSIFISEETAVVDHGAMKAAVNPVYREMFWLCKDCKNKENPEPFACSKCIPKDPVEEVWWKAIK